MVGMAASVNDFSKKDAQGNPMYDSKEFTKAFPLRDQNQLEPSLMAPQQDAVLRAVALDSLSGNVVSASAVQPSSLAVAKSTVVGARKSVAKRPGHARKHSF